MRLNCQRINGPRAMLFLPGRLQGRGPYAPPGKPIRTYPFGVKITRGVESANFFDRNAILSRSKHFCGRYELISFRLFVIFSLLRQSWHLPSGIITKFEFSNVLFLGGRQRIANCKQMLMLNIIYFSKNTSF